MNSTFFIDFQISFPIILSIIATIIVTSALDVKQLENYRSSVRYKSKLCVHTVILDVTRQKVNVRQINNNIYIITHRRRECNINDNNINF